jgi:replicative superfamily II helicase
MKRRDKFKIREKIFALLGDQCRFCGEREWRCLVIDHVNRNGKEERKKTGIGIKNFIYILHQIRKGSKDYQLLCASCSLKKDHVWFGYQGLTLREEIEKLEGVIREECWKTRKK